jgi:hypothetical protein
MDSICRFCYEPKLSQTDPLITPCKCIGSVRYVHLQCLKQWRFATTNPDFATKCQLCLTNFRIPVRHPLETIPLIHNEPIWFFLSRPLIPMFLAHYFYIIIAAHIFREKMLEPPHGYLFPYMPINILTNMIFFSMSTGIFLCYFLFYIKFLRQVKNRMLYTQYWFRFYLDGFLLFLINCKPFQTVNFQERWFWVVYLLFLLFFIYLSPILYFSNF